MKAARKPGGPGGLVLAVVAALLVGCGGETGAGVSAYRRMDCAATVQTPLGPVRGDGSGNAACAYKGIPFAQPPVGELRLNSPVAIEPWTAELDARQYRPDCPQLLTFLSPGGTDEDCLYLNIWRPDRAGLDRLPVMVFIYGGGFTLGGGSWFLYDGTDLTRDGVIVVTINYRLGPLGFLTTPELKAASADGSVGNYAIEDQIEALKWVQKNIAAFGGDAGNVTIFGESAGGWSVCTLLASPKAEGLFHRAIMQSGACNVGSLERQYEEGQKYLADFGCPATGPESLSCFNGKSADAIVSGPFYSMINGMVPTVDGVVVPDQPIASIRAGKVAQVPLLAGYNSGEVKAVKVFPPVARYATTSFDDLWKDVAEKYPDIDLDEFRTLYSSDDYETVPDLWIDVTQDITFSCGAHDAVAAHSGRSASYLYEFSVPAGSFSGEAYTGSYHSIELSYVFGNMELTGLLTNDNAFVNVHRREAALVQRYWTRFAATGDPNGGSDPAWPAYADGHATLLLSDRPVVAYDRKTKRCEFWQRHAPVDFLDLFDYMSRIGDLGASF